MALLSPSPGASSASPRLHPSRLPKPNEQSVEEVVTPAENDESALRVHGVRLMELTDRDSSVMRVSEQALWDPVINTFKAFGEWNHMDLMAGVSVVPEHSYADTIVNTTRQDAADLLLLSWSETGTLIDRYNGLELDAANRFGNGAYTDFVCNVLERVPGNVGILVESSPDHRSNSKRPASTRSASAQGIPWPRQSTGHRSHHVVLPYFGGEDDRFALRFVLQIAQNDHVTATIIQMSGLLAESSKTAVSTAAPVPGPSGSPVTSDSQSDIVFFETLRDSISDNIKERVVFQQIDLEESISDPVHMARNAIDAELNHAPDKSGTIVVVGRRSITIDSGVGSSSDDTIGSDTRRALGSMASAMVQPGGNVNGSVFILQAGVDAALLGDFR